MLRKYALFLLLNLISTLAAEVQEVQVFWDPLLCQQSCIDGLRKRFALIQGVQDVSMNLPNGSATLTWKPQAPFSFTPINYALRYIGIREKYVRVKVRGTISIQGLNYNLISDGDRSKFLLINRITPNPNEYTIQFNPQNRELSPDLKNQLQIAQRSRAMVVVEGTLFMPERSPPDPLSLIIDQIKIEDTK